MFILSWHWCRLPTRHVKHGRPLKHSINIALSSQGRKKVILRCFCNGFDDLAWVAASWSAGTFVGALSLYSADHFQYYLMQHATTKLSTAPTTPPTRPPTTSSTETPTTLSTTSKVIDNIMQQQKILFDKGHLKRNMMMRLTMSRMNRNEENDNFLRSTIGLLKHKIQLTKRFDLYLYLSKQQQRDSWHWLAQYSQYTAHPTHCLASEDGESWSSFSICSSFHWVGNWKLTILGITESRKLWNE